MNIRDKMRLLFEDMNRQAETAGKEFVLTPQERKAIVDDARITGEITELRRVNELYRTSTFISIDMEITELFLYLSISQLEKTLIGILLKGATEDIIGEMIYDLVRQQGVPSEEINKQMNELRVKYKVDNVLFRGFDLFFQGTANISLDVTSEFLQPNPDIQKSFIAAFRHAKKLKKKLYEMAYVIKKSPIDFLPESTKKLIKDSEDLLSLFTNLDSSLKPFRIYRDFGMEISKNTQLSVPQFFEIIQDISKSIDLADNEKVSLEAEIDKSLNEEL